jgi:hypothetical protein
VIDLGSLPAFAQATLLVGIVFLQAVVLYVGYGAVERVATPLIETITDA